MSSFLCVICHSTVNSDTSEDTRDKYREVVGMNLCLDSQLCYICCHVLNKFWLFKSICLKRSLEYPVLFSEKGTLNLQRSDVEVHSLCFEHSCNQYQSVNINSSYHYSEIDNTNRNNDKYDIINEYIEFADDRNEYNDNTNYDHNFESLHDIAGNINDTCSLDNTETAQSFNSDNDISQNLTEIGDVNNDIYNDNEMETSNNITDNENTNDANNGIYYNNETEYNEIGRNKEMDNVGRNNDIYTDGLSNELEMSTTNEIDGNIDINNDVYAANENNDIDAANENNDVENESLSKKSKSKEKTKRKKEFCKFLLSLEEQKAELESNRRQKKYIEAEFKCYNCALSFLFKDTYQAHMMRHEESNGEYRCGVCTLRFATPAVLRAHGSLHAERHRCRRCGAVLRPRERPPHEVACYGRQPTTHTCHACGREFQGSSGLQQHLKRFHQMKATTRSYSCNVCGKSYSNQAAVRTHMITHVQRRFNCEQCPASFSSPYTLTEHRKKHEPGPLHHCQPCGASFARRKDLMAHKRNSINHQNTVFECLICGRICPNQRSLSSHIETVHSATRDFGCPRCPSKFSTQRALSKHARRHDRKTQPTLSICHLCGSCFKGNSKLARHLREVCEKEKLEEELSAYYG